MITVATLTADTSTTYAAGEISARFSSATSQTESELGGKSELAELLSAAIVNILKPHSSMGRLSSDRIFTRLEKDIAPTTASIRDMATALTALTTKGLVEEIDASFQLAKAALVTTRLPGDEMTGLSVQVRRDQKRLGGAKCPGRKGVVISENEFGRSSHGGLWNVRLEPTNRSAERVDTFWGTELDVI